MPRSLADRWRGAFLFSKNRLNVAIWRVPTLAVVVGNPGLARTRCSTLEEMQLVNVFCRAVDAGASSASADVMTG
ncbi:MAG: hypothetical protein AAB403_15060 [Planctomycetota bacterium]